MQKNERSVRRLEQCRIVKTVGSRLKEARELANMSQQKAAKLLGYANSSKLAKIECASDTYSVPMWLIVRAARLYEVSLDFLFGESDDWEYEARKTQEREVSRWLFDYIEKTRKRDMDMLKKLHNRLEAISQSVDALTEAIDEIDCSFTVFQAANETFIDMPKGSKLVWSVNNAIAAKNNAEAKMKRFKDDCKKVNENNNSQGELWQE